MGTTVMDELFAGGIAGCISLIVGHPLDTMKTMMQSSKDVHPNPITPWGYIIEQQRSYFTGTPGRSISQVYESSQMRHLAREIRTRGYARFFCGLSVPFWSYGGVNAVYFMAYRQVLSSINPSDPTTGDMVIAGTLAGVAQLSVNTPVEVVKIKMQNQATSSSTPLARHYIASILKNEGIVGMYRGITAHAMRDMPASAVYFSSYSVVSEYLRRTRSWDIFTASFMGGAIAGVASWIITMPVDVIKTKMQADKSASFRTCIRDMNREGISGWFKGSSLCIVRAFFVNAVIFVCYESIINAIENYRQRDRVEETL